MVSVAGCDVPPASGDMEVSSMSSPAENRHEGRHRGHARGVMGVQMDRHFDRGFQPAHQTDRRRAGPADRPCP